jgi:hypothetical protein
MTTADRKPYVISMTEPQQIDVVEKWTGYLGMTRTKAITAACMLAFKYEEMRRENEMLRAQLIEQRAGSMSDEALIEMLKKLNIR